MYEMCCPHCKTELSIKQAVEILNGSGYELMVRVRTPDGRIFCRPAHEVNPNEVEILE
jgi:uncharacterized protein YbaR (Trm112 family)